ncbi:MAG: hypothetical protein NZ889_00225 [Candidatus Pacearchaeota archaeon]|nr:hypothetical protein [Candidatus Pacearchaeota archaeon]
MPQDINSIAALLSDFTIRINDLEERLKIMHERITILDQTLLKQNQKIIQEIKSIKEEISELKGKIDKVEETIDHIISESQEFARKEEILAIERFMKTWEPMNFATIDDVKEMLKEIRKK